MSIEAMKMALEAMESAIKAGDWVVDGACDPDMALVALRQAIEQAEKQEPFIYVREDNEKLFGGYEHCSEADSGAFPVYTAPVDAVNMKQERVDETAKRKHEPVDYMTEVVAMHKDGTYTTKQVPILKREWVGLTDEEIEECKINGGLPHAINWRLSAKVLQAKLKEKNA